MVEICLARLNSVVQRSLHQELPESAAVLFRKNAKTVSHDVPPKPLPARQLQLVQNAADANPIMRGQHEDRFRRKPYAAGDIILRIVLGPQQPGPNNPSDVGEGAIGLS